MNKLKERLYRMFKKNSLIFVMVLCAFALIAIIVLSVHASAGDNTKDLKLVHIIFQEGTKTPTHTYLNDPYINETFFPTGWGHITNQGMLSLFHHGKFLRDRYGEFLGTRYSPNIYYVQTTDVDEAKVTAQCINSGFWPPNDDQKWGPLDWQPIPIYSDSFESDNLLLVTKPCERYTSELRKLQSSSDIQAKLNRYLKMFEAVGKYTGMDIKTFEDAKNIYETLMAEEAFNLTLPEWTKQYYPDKLAEPAIFYYVLNAYTDELNRLKGGVFLKKLLNDWENTKKGVLRPNERKAFLYVGHYSTIVNLLSALKVWDPQLPRSTVSVLLEFSQDKYTKQYGIQVFLRNSTHDATPILLKIPNCEYFCPFSRLVNLTETMMPDDWEAECKLDRSSNDK